LVKTGKNNELTGMFSLNIHKKLKITEIKNHCYCMPTGSSLPAWTCPPNSASLPARPCA